MDNMVYDTISSIILTSEFRSIGYLTSPCTADEATSFALTIVLITLISLMKKTFEEAAGKFKAITFENVHWIGSLFA